MSLREKYSINCPDFKNLSELISINANLYPKKKYIFFKDKTYTYKEAEDAVAHTAQVLSENGVKKGDRVGILLGNSPEYIFAYFAVVRIGAVGVPLNVFLKEREISLNLNDCGAEYIITSALFSKVVAPLPELIPSLKKIFTYGEAPFKSVDTYSFKTKEAPVKTEVTRSDLAVLIYTSGTTGQPKGVMLTHNNLLENAYTFVLAIKTVHKDRYVALLPMFHSYAFMCCVIGPLVSGGSIVILESILDATKSDYKKMLLLKRPTVMLGVPQLYSAMARMKVSWIQRLLYPFRLSASGGAPLPVETINNFKRNFGKPVIEGYGLSEASPIVAFNPMDKQKPGTIGKALPGIEVRIADDDDNTLGVNQVGELCVRGDNVMQGYWNQPGETAKALKNGWLHTGDVATIDEEGYITIVDRIKDLILVKGMNVYPREIEELLYQVKLRWLSSAPMFKTSPPTLPELLAANAVSARKLFPEKEKTAPDKNANTLISATQIIDLVFRVIDCFIVDPLLFVS